MVDDWLIAVRNKAKDVVGRCEHDQKRDQSDADAPCLQVGERDTISVSLSSK